jgi:UDP-N-acetylglucosamine diphosphorylase / glucose-1-phosphate thymidylyltransferase / UDP-N-acetylgalactosamine diphosphorylase / glucosamine-1-phosphate N-acetyltransferase / galactosamine-1-phosphate N-acetyltransferase
MWWNDLNHIESEILKLSDRKNNFSELTSKNILIDESLGPIIIGHNTIICENVTLKGPIYIGNNCLIGNNCFIRSNTFINDNVKVGFSTEIKNSIIENDVCIGPQCFVADSIIKQYAYLGAQVRTSNHRLDKKNISVIINEKLIDTGKEKLGCYIGENSSLGVQVVILPGRVVPENSLFGPKIIIEKNFSSGRYLLNQSISKLQD